MSEERIAPPPRKTVFLDRDGVVTVESGEYVTRPEDLRLLPGAAEAIAKLTANDWQVFLFTNQAGVGRGCFTLEMLNVIHARLQALLAADGGNLTGIYCCPHHPDDGCDCRKPKTGMLRQAASDHALNLTTCYVIGDTPRDIAAGNAVGCATLLVLTGHTDAYDATTFPDPQPDHVFPNLSVAADWLSALDRHE